MGNPVIVEAGRTAIGKRNGAFADLHAAKLLGAAQVGVLERAGIEAGYPANDDFNGPSQEGIGRYDYNIVGGRRWSAAREATCSGSPG